MPSDSFHTLENPLLVEGKGETVIEGGTDSAGEVARARIDIAGGAELRGSLALV